MCYSNPITCASETDKYSYLLNQTRSPLLRLPGELRNKIFEYALSDWAIHARYKNCDPGIEADFRCIFLGEAKVLPPNRSILALSLVSRQVHAETDGLLFSDKCVNDFFVPVRFLSTLNKRISKEHREQIRTIHIPMLYKSEDVWLQGGRWSLDGSSVDGPWHTVLSVLQQFVGIERVILMCPVGRSLETSQWLARILNAGNFLAKNKGGVQVTAEKL
jgi:hypothetical protein